MMKHDQMVKNLSSLKSYGGTREVPSCFIAISASLFADASRLAQTHLLAQKRLLANGEIGLVILKKS